MATTVTAEMAASTGMLYLTTAGTADNSMTNTTISYGGNMTDMYNENTTTTGWDETNIMYQFTAYLAEYLWIVLIFGVPGNLASIYTIMSMSTVSSSKAHVAILALTDTIAIVSKVIYYRLSDLAISMTVPGCILIMFVQQFCTAYANWVVVAMTTERFLAVWFPLQVGRMYTRRKALIVLACLALTTTCVYIFFFWAFTEEFIEDYGYKCELKKEYYEFIHTFGLFEGFYYAVLPCTLILIGNILIITNIKRARKAQRHLTNAFDQGSRKARDQRQITVMLIVVSVVFLLLNVPSAIYYFINSCWVVDETSYEYLQKMFTARFVHMLADANHAVNFYLYFLSMSSFRRKFLDAVRCKKYKRRRPGANSLSRTSQTYLHSGHHSCDTSRLDNSIAYSAYKRSSSSTLDQAQPLKAINSNNNRANHHPQNVNILNCIDSASSDV